MVNKLINRTISNVSNMKFRKIIAALLMIIPWMTACAGLQTTSPPTPVVKWPFDVSKRDSKVNQDFRIREYRSYYFALRFDYVGFDGEDRVFKLVGHGSEGIAIPIHIKIIKLDAGNLPSELKYENTITTNGYFAHASGYYLRRIIAIDLKPGIYRVEANTIEDRPAFSGTPSHLQIEGHSKIKFLPDSIK